MLKSNRRGCGHVLCFLKKNRKLPVISNDLYSRYLDLKRDLPQFNRQAATYSVVPKFSISELVDPHRVSLSA